MKTALVKRRNTLPAVISRPVAMLALADDMCKYAVGRAPDRGHLFCGKAAVRNSSWCAEHFGVVWAHGTVRKAKSMAYAPRGPVPRRFA